MACLEPCVTLAYSELVIIRILAYLEPQIYLELSQDIRHIQDFTIFRILRYLGPEAYLELCQLSKMEGLAL